MSWIVTRTYWTKERSPDLRSDIGWSSFWSHQKDIQRCMQAACRKKQVTKHSLMQGIRPALFNSLLEKVKNAYNTVMQEPGLAEEEIDTYYQQCWEHGLKNQPSNRAKPTFATRQIFRAFIRLNRVPTGRQKGKKYWMDSQFLRIYNTRGDPSTDDFKRSIGYAFQKVVEEIHAEGKWGHRVIFASKLFGRWSALQQYSPKAS